MERAKEDNKAPPPRSQIAGASPGTSLAQRMASLEEAEEEATLRAMEAAMYKGKGGGMNINDQAAQLEAMGIGSALLAQAASGPTMRHQEVSEVRRVVKDEANRVMH